MKVVVTDYIEPDLEWEAAQMARRGIEFAAYQLKFTSAERVIEATRDADVVVVNMVPVTAEIVSGWERCRLLIRHGVGYDNVDLAALERAGIPCCYIPDYIVNRRTLAMMKPTAYLVNTSRGPMVDTEALAEALNRGTIAGAAIDVLEREPPPPDHPLFSARNVILTPHLAWYSEDAARRIRELIVLEIDRFAAGLPPRYVAKAEAA